MNELLRDVLRALLCLTCLLRPCALPAFDELPSSDKRLKSLKAAAVHAGLSGQLLPQEDAYSLALGMQRILYCLQVRGQRLYALELPVPKPFKLLHTLQELAPRLQASYPLIGTSLEEVELTLNALETSLQHPEMQAQKPATAAEGLHLKTARAGTQSYTQLAKFGAMVDMTLKGLNQMDGSLKVGTMANQKVNGESQFTDAKLQLEESRLEYRASRDTSVHAGRVLRQRGMGLNGMERMDGLGVRTSIGANELQIGWFEGLDAQIESPFILGEPFTFYTRQKRLKELNRDSWFTGLHGKSKIGVLNWETELNEYHDPSSPKNYESAGFQLGAPLHDRLDIGTGLTRTDAGYKSPGDYNPFLRDTGILQDALLSMSSYRGREVRELDGYTGFHAMLDYRSKAGSFGLQVDRALDEKLSDGEQSFWLSSLHWKRAIGLNSRLNLSLHRMQWTDSPQEQDFHLVRSAIAFDF